jgi:hypothetical protein
MKNKLFSLFLATASLSANPMEDVDAVPELSRLTRVELAAELSSARDEFRRKVMQRRSEMKKEFSRQEREQARRSLMDERKRLSAIQWEVARRDRSEKKTVAVVPGCSWPDDIPKDRLNMLQAMHALKRAESIYLNSLGPMDADERNAARLDWHRGNRDQFQRIRKMVETNTEKINRQKTKKSRLHQPEFIGLKREMLEQLKSGAEPDLQEFRRRSIELLQRQRASEKSTDL